MIKIEIKNRFTDKILFEYPKENNTIKETVLQAIKEKADLSSADLHSADLRSADLRSADLSSADLSSADLRHAILSSADLRSADLSSADLRHADLSYAKTDNRYIQISCIGSEKRMTTYCFEDDLIICGCFTGTLKEFEKKVKYTYSNKKQWLAEYLGFITYLKNLKKIK